MCPQCDKAYLRRCELVSHMHRTHGEMVSSRSSTPSQPDAARQNNKEVPVITEAAVRVASQTSDAELAYKNRPRPPVRAFELSPATAATVDWQPRQQHPLTSSAHSIPFTSAPMALSSSSLERLGYSTLLAAAEQAGLSVPSHSQLSGSNCCVSDTGANVGEARPTHGSRADGGGPSHSAPSGMALLTSAIAQDVATKANCPYTDCKCGLDCSCVHCAW